MSGKFAIPFAIIVSALIVAGAIFFSGSRQEEKPRDQFAGPIVAPKTQIGPRAPSTDDHVLGNPMAKIVIIEYADPECPFCKDMHPTLTRIVDEFGREGNVAWVYRQFPVIQKHSQAMEEAEAIECAGVVAGNSGFFAYLGKLYAVTPSNNNLPLEELTSIAKELNFNMTTFDDCRKSDETLPRIKADIEDGVAVGVTGTPFTVITGPNDSRIIVEGSRTYLGMKSILNQFLAQTK